MQKRKVWLIQLPLIVVWTLAFLIAQCGDDGTLSSNTLRTGIYPMLRRMEGIATDWKFRLRGARAPKQKIVIVEIDDRAIEMIGRWPWHRDAVGVLVQQVMDAGAKVVGLDIVFPEADTRVPEGVGDLLRAHSLGDEIPQFETDLVLQRIIDVNRDRLVLGWMADRWCRPAYPDDRPCPVTDKEELGRLPPNFDKFAYAHFLNSSSFDAAGTLLASTPEILGNLPGYTDSAKHAGYLVNAWEDGENIVRRAQVALFVGGKPYPSLPLEMARVGLDDFLSLSLDERGRVDRAELERSGLRIPVSPAGTLSINFRGPGYHFPYVGAADLLTEDDVIPVQSDGKIDKKPRAELFDGAYVFIGVTAIGARDLRNFPFGSNIPGTEGLATILDNVLSGDVMRHGLGIFDWRAILVLMTAGAFLFGLALVRLDALVSLVVSVLVIGALALIDVGYFFSRRNVDLSTVFLFAELGTMFIATVAVKYVLEERSKKFIRSTFSKYLAPAVVDDMLKDPSKLRLGGETRRLTIMMSDLRGFSAMSERLKPAQVLGMLNHYLGVMADLIFEHNGTIDEFIGDAILVIFGAPTQRPDDARRAVACAVAMQRAMRDINAHFASQGLPPIEMGIGLNTGDVIVGNIGSQKHIKYGVVGSHVNLTGRIESNTVGGQVLISGTTLEAAGPDISHSAPQLISAKGFAEPIPTYDIKGIGGEYKLFLEEIDLALETPVQPIDVSYAVLKGKNDEGPEQSGKLCGISVIGAQIEGVTALEPLTNIRIRVHGAGDKLDGDLYAKVLDGGGRFSVRFTGAPPKLASYVADVVPPPLNGPVTRDA
jgi:class 3 adenylate cyclase